MTKIYEDTEITLPFEVRVNGVLTDPSTIEFRYRINRDGRRESPTPTKLSTGSYQVTFTPDTDGILFGEWRTTGTPTITEPVRIPIFDSFGIRG